jgi:hypothetical protein
VELADLWQHSFDDLVLQSIQVGLPPNLDRVPVRFRADLEVLGRLGDETLWRVAYSDMEDDKVALYQELLAKNERDELSEADRARLDALREEADLLMLRRSYAFALLKWRGHSIPAPADLERA